jgi:hypothetical protein
MNLRGARLPAAPFPAAINSLSAIVAGVMTMVMLPGCGQNSSEREEPPPIEDTVFAEPVDALKRTENQVKEMEGRKQDLDAQLEEAEGEPRDDRGE